MTVWLVHTRFNRRPIALPSLFCKNVSKSDISGYVRAAEKQQHSRKHVSTAGVRPRAQTLLRASTFSRHTPHASSLAFLMPGRRMQEEKSRELSSGCTHTHTKHTTWFTSWRRATCNHVCFIYVGTGCIKSLHVSSVLFCLNRFGSWTVFMFKLQTFPAHLVPLSSIKVWNKKIKIQLDRCVYSGLDLNMESN